MVVIYYIAMHSNSIQNQFIVKLFFKLIPTFNGFANKCYIIEYADIIYLILHLMKYCSPLLSKIEYKNRHRGFKETEEPP